MKKYIVPVLIFIFYCLSVRSQDTIYLDNHWKETVKESASFFRVKWKKESGWQVKDCYVNGSPQMEGFYSDDSCKVSEGKFSYYDEKGKLYHVVHFEKGKLNGVDQLFYDDGQIRTTGKYLDGKQSGEWLGYYPSGKLAARAEFKNGDQTTGNFYNENGSKNELISEFSHATSFPGGLPRLQRFLNRNIKYPDSAAARNIQGSVLIKFDVDKKGKVQNAVVASSTDSLFAKEALRVIRLMPDWEPLIIGGILCDSHQKQPINFALQ